MSAVTHVGVTVSDLAGAVAWYRDVLGFEPLGPPVAVSVEDGHAGAMAADVFGPTLGRFRQAHLAGANGVALELFEFLAPPTERRDLHPWATGTFHACLLARDIDGTVERIVRSGGRRRTSHVWPIYPGEPYRACYCEDPFGNVFELYSHSHERVYANRVGAAR